LFGGEGEVAERDARTIKRRWFVGVGTGWRRWWQAVASVGERLFSFGFSKGNERERASGERSGGRGAGVAP
jgi:hypothetical protein